LWKNKPEIHCGFCFLIAHLQKPLYEHPCHACHGHGLPAKKKKENDVQTFRKKLGSFSTPGKQIEISWNSQIIDLNL
jgi:hypothetical protein